MIAINTIKLQNSIEKSKFFTKLSFQALKLIILYSYIDIDIFANNIVDF